MRERPFLCPIIELEEESKQDRFILLKYLGLGGHKEKTFKELGRIYHLSDRIVSRIFHKNFDKVFEYCLDPEKRKYGWVEPLY